MIRRISIIAIILAAAVLVYGFIDAWSYRVGYTAGSVKVSRLVGVACEKGLVEGDSLCEAAESVLYPAPASAIIGLAQVSAITDGVPSSASAGISPAAQRRAARGARRAGRLQQSSVTTPVDVITSVSQAESAAPPPPSVSPETQGIIDRVSAAQALPANHCSKRTNLECGSGGFDCAVSQTTYLCDFTSTVTGLRAVPADRVIQSTACLTRAVIDRLGVGTFVEGSQVSVCANKAIGRFVYLSMPADVRPLAELLLNADPVLRAFAKAAGASVITVTQSAPALESCMARGQRFAGQPMPSMRPGIDCAMDSGMMMPSCPSNRWSSTGQCLSSLYIPSTLAQIADIISSFFLR